MKNSNSIYKKFLKLRYQKIPYFAKKKWDSAIHDHLAKMPILAFSPNTGFYNKNYIFKLSSKTISNIFFSRNILSRPINARDILPSKIKKIFYSNFSFFS
jgi:hypothetical protein